MSDGIRKTTIDKIAHELHMSKKTIYLLFQTKDNLLFQSFKWKLDRMAGYGNRIIKMDISAIEKLLKLLRAIHLELKNITIEGLKSTYSYRDQTNEILEEYLKGAVFERFKALIQKCHEEELLISKVDINTMLLTYWETLSSFIFGRPAGKLIESTITRPFNEHLNIQLINFFRGFLNEEGVRKFDSALSKDPILSEHYA